MLRTQQGAGAPGAGLNPSLAMGKAEWERRGDGEGRQAMNSPLGSARAWLVPLPGLNHEDVLIKEIQFWLVLCQPPSTRRQTSPADKAGVPLLWLTPPFAWRTSPHHGAHGKPSRSWPQTL